MRKAYSYIRMSTNVQLKGDSLHRQLQASETYANTHNLQLVDSIDGIPLKDIGVSGFNGKNSQIGVLSLFLNFLESGKIEPNSVLLIESLDRLSRDRLSEALSQFMGILNRDIEIITLLDNQSYTKEIINRNPTALYISLGIMFRANEESETKSKRLKAAWASKRENAGEKKLSRLCPAWLNYSEVTEKFVLIESKANIVRKIFQMCISTCGLYGIARYLNENNIPVFGSGKLWYRSYIKKIISNRAVLGEFQSFSMIENKRQPFGEPVANYFPPVIDENTFYLANAALSRRDISEKGRKGISFSNLFSGVVYCGSCNFTMTLRNRGLKSGGKVLQCSNKQVAGGCNASVWNSAQFEEVIFNHLLEVDFKSLLINEEKYDSLTDEIAVLQQKQNTKQIEVTRALDLSLGSDLTSESKLIVINKLNSLNYEVDILKKQILLIKNSLEEQKNNDDLLSKAELQHMVEILHQNHDDYFFRSKLNQILKKTIDRIELYDDENNFQVWDIDQDDPAVKQYQYENKSQQFAVFVESDKFERFYKTYYKRLIIKYKSGAVRHLLYGADISFKNNTHLIRPPVTI